MWAACTVASSPSIQNVLPALPHLWLCLQLSDIGIGPCLNCERTGWHPGGHSNGDHSRERSASVEREEPVAMWIRRCSTTGGENILVLTIFTCW